MSPVRVCNKEIHGTPAAKVFKVAGLVILGIIGAAALAIVFGLIIQWLWNSLMPDIFGLPQVSYWQAVGLVVLSHILFGGHGHESKSHAHRKIRSKSKCRTETEENMEWDSFREFWNDFGRDSFTNWLHSNKEPKPPQSE